MAEVLFLYDLHLMVDAVSYLISDLAITLLTTFYCFLIKPVKGLPVVHVFKIRECKAEYIPVFHTLIGNFYSIGYSIRGMGKLVNHGLCRIKKIVFSAVIVLFEPGELAVKINCPQDPVELKLFFSD